MVDQRWPIKVGARWAWQSIKPTPKCPCHMRVLCEKRVLDLAVETRMQQGILGFVKGNYFSSGMLSLGSPAGPPAGSVAGLAILGYLSCLILCIGAHITWDNQDVRQVDSSPCDSFSAIRIGGMPVGPATASQLQGSTLGTWHSIHAIWL